MVVLHLLVVELERVVQSSSVTTFTLASLVAVGLFRVDKMSPPLSPRFRFLTLKPPKAIVSWHRPHPDHRNFQGWYCDEHCCGGPRNSQRL